MTQFQSVRGRGGSRGGGPGRRILKIGIGGFNVKMPRNRTFAPETSNQCESNYCQNSNDDQNSPDIGSKIKIRRQRRPKRPVLEEAYPSTIQVLFLMISDNVPSKQFSPSTDCEICILGIILWYRSCGQS